MPTHLLVPNFKSLLVRLLRLHVHARFLTFLAILVQQFEKLHHLIIDQIIMDPRIEFGLVKQCQKLVKSDHFLRIEDNTIQQIIIEYFYCCALSEQLYGIRQLYIALFPFVDFIELLQQLLELVAGLVEHFFSVNIILFYYQRPQSNILMMYVWEGAQFASFKILIIMYFSLAQHNNIFVRPEKSNLIIAVPLCARTVIFFCDDLNFYHYSLIDNKILYQSKLPGRPIQAISLSGHEILCTIFQSRALMLLNIEERSFEQICKLPQTKIHNQNKEKDIFTQTKLHIFEKSNKFYIEEPKVQENKTKIYYYGSPTLQGQKIKMENFVTKELNTRRMVLKKLDSEGSLVLFRQDIDQNGIFKFSTVNCEKQFFTSEYVMQHQSLTRFATVREIRSISNPEDSHQRMMVFINSSNPQILIFSNNEVTEFAYKPKKIFLSTILINIQMGYGMFMFMPEQTETNPSHDHVIEFINFKTAKVLERKKLNVHSFVKSWEDDYLLLYRRENVVSNASPFQTENIICKKAFYMKILWEKGFIDLSENFMGEVMNCLQ